jgi:hypothetical protein
MDYLGAVAKVPGMWAARQMCGSFWKVLNFPKAESSKLSKSY